MRFGALVLCTLSTLLLAIAFATTASPAHAGPRLDAGERAVVRAINRARSHHGLRSLRTESRLARAADAHSQHMLATDSFAHGAFVQRVRSFVGYHRIGETIAMLARCNARRAVRMWLHSPGHRAVVLSPGYSRVGVGRRVGRLGRRRACLVTADFASRR